MHSTRTYLDADALPLGGEDQGVVEQGGGAAALGVDADEPHVVPHLGQEPGLVVVLVVSRGSELHWVGLAGWRVRSFDRSRTDRQAITDV